MTLGRRQAYQPDFPVERDDFRLTRVLMLFKIVRNLVPAPGDS